MKTATERAPRGLFLRDILSRDVALLELSNSRSTPPEICGDSIASRCLAVRKRGCENESYAAPNKGSDAVWQRRSVDKALRKTLINTGISKPFRRHCEQGFVFRGRALCFSRPTSPLFKGSGSSLRNKHFFLNCFGLPTPRKSQEGARIDQISGDFFLFRTQTSSVDLPVVHEFQNFWVEQLTVRGNFEAKNIMTWHMNWGYGPSCACGTQKVVGAVYERRTRMNKNGVPYAQTCAPALDRFCVRTNSGTNDEERRPRRRETQRDEKWDLTEPQKDFLSKKALRLEGF